ncbi:hypothetical protein OLZ31_26460, partial [Enterobacter asburiae]|nr:hypothetical protein [Enterobacter asburiae]
STFISESSRDERSWSMIALSISKSGADFGLAVKSFTELLKILVDETLFGMSGLNRISASFDILAATNAIRILASWEFVLALFFIEQAMAILLDNDLQKWCEGGVFGIKPKKELHSTEAIGIQEYRNKIYDNESEVFLKAVEAII